MEFDKNYPIIPNPNPKVNVLSLTTVCPFEGETYNVFDRQCKHIRTCRLKLSMIYSYLWFITSFKIKEYKVLAEKKNKESNIFAFDTVLAQIFSSLCLNIVYFKYSFSLNQVDIKWPMSENVKFKLILCFKTIENSCILTSGH